MRYDFYSHANIFSFEKTENPGILKTKTNDKYKKKEAIHCTRLPPRGIWGGIHVTLLPQAKRLFLGFKPVRQQLDSCAYDLEKKITGVS